MYGNDFQREVKPDILLTEDSNSGYQFFHAICKNRQLECTSANGKSNIFSCLIEHKEGTILVIADGGAFGAEMDKIMKLLGIRKDIVLYLPESFEWLVLKSGVIQDGEISQILDAPYDYLESSEYFSWERYFTALIVQKTQGTYMKYNKRILNNVYMQTEIAEKIVESLDNIDLSWKK